MWFRVRSCPPGIAPATLKLFRGGQVRICPHSGLSISASGNGLMLATGAGAVEVDYELGAQAVDVLITPDFNVTLVGPGTYHFALGVNKKGDTCVKPMAGNASAISFSELLGTGTYKSAAEEMTLFPAGKTDGHKTLTTDCGCPSTLPVIRTETAPPGPAKDQPEAAKGERVLVATPQPAASAPADQSGQVRGAGGRAFCLQRQAGRQPALFGSQIASFQLAQRVFCARRCRSSRSQGKAARSVSKSRPRTGGSGRQA